MPWSQPLFWTAWPRLALALAITVWAWSVSRAVVRRWYGRPPWDLEACGTAALTATLVLAPALVLGTFGILRDWSWAMAVVLTAGAVHLLARPSFQAPSRSGPEPPPDPSPVFQIAVGGVLIGRALYALRNPPADWDSLHYHLPMIAHWIQSGALGVALREPPAFGSYFPGNGELLQTWVAWAAMRETLVPWVGIAATGLLALALRRLGLMAGSRPAHAEAAAAALVLAPQVVQLTLGTRIDVVLAMAFAFALWFALRFRLSGTRGDGVLMLLSAGLMSGTKGTGPVYAALVVLLAIASSRLVERLGALLSARAALATAALMGGFWVVRNAIAVGNPLYPAEVQMAGRVLPGLMSREDLWRTSQIQVWREGFAGHLAPANVIDFFGPAIVVLGLATVVGVFAEATARRPARPRIEPWLLLWLGAVTLALFLVGPFSGAYLPSADGVPPPLNRDNLRLLLPAAIALLPLAARGLSALPAPGLWPWVIAALIVFPLARHYGHALAGLAIAAAIAAARLVLPSQRGTRTAAAAIGLASLGLALALAAVEPARERISDRIWDDYRDDIPSLSARTIRDLRARAGGRPIAYAGFHAWWAFYGRDFSGHPVYVPVEEPWTRQPDYRFPRDDRARADRARWLANLTALDPAFLVVQPDGEGAPLPEADWIRNDPRFRTSSREGRATIYAIGAGAGAGIVP